MMKTRSYSPPQRLFVFTILLVCLSQFTFSMARGHEHVRSEYA